MEKIFGDPPYPPKKADFGRTKAKMGRFSQMGLCCSFGILHGLLTHKKNRISNGGKNLGTPPSPPKKPIWGEQKPKWAVSSRSVCPAILEFCMGS